MMTIVFYRSIHTIEVSAQGNYFFPMKIIAITPTETFTNNFIEFQISVFYLVLGTEGLTAVCISFHFLPSHCHCYKTLFLAFIAVRKMKEMSFSSHSSQLFTFCFRLISYLLKFCVFSNFYRRLVAFLFVFGLFRRRAFI